MQLDLHPTAGPSDLATGDEAYWDLVRRTLSDVFGDEQPEARVQDLREALGRRPLTEQVMFRHTDPFDVARRLIDPDHEMVIGEEEIARYRNLLDAAA